MHTISIKLSDDLLTKIRSTAKKRGETRSAVMREALEEYLSESKEQTAGSCLDLARDVAGCVEGPADLSTNPAHLERYGR